LKVATYFERRGTTKGEKDFLDIFTLIKNGKIDWQKYKELIEKYRLKEINQKLKK
jgi:hypothetical protein